MAQKVVGLIKLQIPAGKATPAPPVGPALGQHGVNIVAFTKDFNERTKNDAGLLIRGRISGIRRCILIKKPPESSDGFSLQFIFILISAGAVYRATVQ